MGQPVSKERTADRLSAPALEDAILAARPRYEEQLGAVDAEIAEMDDRGRDVVQAAAIGLIAISVGFGWWAAGAILLGIGTAMVYPTLLAVVGNVAHPEWRASAVGVYRLWRDAGFAGGALLTGVVADLFGLVAAVLLVAAITAGLRRGRCSSDV